MYEVKQPLIGFPVEIHRDGRRVVSVTARETTVEEDVRVATQLATLLNLGLPLGLSAQD